MTPLGRWPQLDMELSSDGFGCSFDLFQLRFVIQIEQPVDLRSMNAELAGEISLAGPGFDHRAIKLELCRYDGWKPDASLAAARRRRSRNCFASPNAALQRCGNSIGGAYQCVGLVRAKSRDFRQIRGGHKDSAVVIWRQFHWVAQHLSVLL